METKDAGAVETTVAGAAETKVVAVAGVGRRSGLVPALVGLAIAMAGCTDASKSINVDTSNQKGLAAYRTNCMQCHQADGNGIKGSFPPLTSPESWTTGPPERVIDIVLKGLEGPLTIDGTTYNGVMIGLGHLPDDEIAAVISFIRASWGHTASPVSAEQVAERRKALAGRRTPMNTKELH